MQPAFRPFRPSDADALAHHANNYNISRRLMDRFPHPYTLDDARQFIEMTLSANPITVFAITVNDEAVGGIGLHPQADVFRKNAELGYWLAEPYWGHGIVPTLIPQVVAWGFENLDVNRIYARPFGTNIASQRVLEKAGFKLEARFEKSVFKNEAFDDELVYSIRKL